MSEPYVLATPDRYLYLTEDDDLSPVEQVETVVPRRFATLEAAVAAWEDRVANFKTEGETPFPLLPMRYHEVFGAQ